MRESLRPTVPRLEGRIGGFTTLARLAHEAEDSGDDILLLEVADEMGRREQERPGCYSIFQQEYIRLHEERARQLRAARGTSQGTSQGT